MNRSLIRDLGIVVAVAFAIRLLALLTLPLIVTNDGSFYLQWGTMIANGQWPEIPAYRTPFYPIWLAGVLAVAGPSVHAVLASHHALSIATAAAIWWLGRTTMGPRVGLVAGILVALDPWLLAISSFALSDIVSVAFPLVALALVAGQPGVGRATIAGLLLGAAVLTRPTTVAWVPGILALCLIAPAGRPMLRWWRPGAVLAALVLTLTPWVAFNATRGIAGVARTEGLAMWGGLARSGQLDAAFELPEQLQPLAKPLFQHTPPEHAVMRFYNAAGDIEAIDRSELLSGWSRASLNADPAGYLQAAAHALTWQANAHLPRTPYSYDSLRWMMRRLGGTDARPDAPANISTHQLPELMARFEDGPPTGPLASLYREWDLGMKQRYPQLPLGLLTLVAIGLAIYRRRWQLVVVLASSFPIVAGHAIIVQPFSRYSISAWLVWWLGGLAATMMIASFRPRSNNADTGGDPPVTQTPPQSPSPR